MKILPGIKQFIYKPGKLEALIAGTAAASHFTVHFMQNVIYFILEIWKRLNQKWK